MASQIINQTFTHAKQHDILSYIITLSNSNTLNNQSNKTWKYIKYFQNMLKHFKTNIQWILN
jgi:hypothetical protein